MVIEPVAFRTDRSQVTVTFTDTTGGLYGKESIHLWSVENNLLKTNRSTIRLRNTAEAHVAKVTIHLDLDRPIQILKVSAGEGLLTVLPWKMKTCHVINFQAGG